MFGAKCSTNLITWSPRRTITVCIAVGLCHGIPNDHTCPIYGAKIVRTATHGLSCRHTCSPGRHHCHAAINDIIHRTLSASYIASPLEPLGFFRSVWWESTPMVPWRNWYGTPPAPVQLHLPTLPDQPVGLV